MVNDAKAHDAEDRKKRELIDARNNADQLVYQTEKQLKEFEGKIDADTRAKVQAAADRLKDTLKRDDVHEIKSATEALQQVWHQASSTMYQQQTQSQQASGGGNGRGGGAGHRQSEDKEDEKKDSSAVDADYEVVD